MIQLRLFEMENDPEYISPQEKRKWSISFRKWCEKKWLEEGSLKGTFCCGCMRICDYCNRKYNEGCKDCVETIKELLNEVPYRDYDFQKILDNLEV